MTDRIKVVRRYKVGDRSVEVSAYDRVGVEDLYDIHVKAELHRIMTGEDLFEPVRRDVKDFLIKTNLFV